MIGESIESILFLGVIGLCTNWIAYSKGFYKLTQPRVPPLSLPFRHVLAVFGIYIGTMLYVAPLVMQFVLFLCAPIPPSLELLTAIQFLILLSVILAFAVYSHFWERDLINKIVKDPTAEGSRPIYYDIGMGVLTWALAFPIVSLIGEVGDLLIYLAFGVENYEQVAVRYLKTTLASPPQLMLALTTIVLIAPITEEFLFRGCLQTYLKRFLGSKASILVTALCFALFHYSSSQDVGNISLIASLFCFALFLGFIYEKQRSLFASISLHMTFNLASALRILFGSEG